MWTGGSTGRRPRGLRIWVLRLVGNRPRNGAEIIQDMEAMTHGWWRPSPGSIYPLLEQLTEEGVLQRRPDGRYELSREARAQQQGWNWGGLPFPKRPEEVVREIDGYVRYLEDLRTSDQAAVKDQSATLRRIAERLRELGN